MNKKFVFPCIALASFSTLIGCKGGGGGGEKEKTEFTITFDTQKGTDVPSQIVKKGEKVIRPEIIPTRGENEVFARILKVNSGLKNFRLFLDLFPF